LSIACNRAEGEHQQDRRVEDDRGDVHAGLGNAVVGGFSVRFEADFVGKGGGDRVAVRPYMLDVARCQPQAHAGGDQQCGEK